MGQALAGTAEVRHIFTSQELLGLGEQQEPGSGDLVEMYVGLRREKVREDF